jgi:hypothetical protein
MEWDDDSWTERVIMTAVFVLAGVGEMSASAAVGAVWATAALIVSVPLATVAGVVKGLKRLRLSYAEHKRGQYELADDKARRHFTNQAAQNKESAARLHAHLRSMAGTPQKSAEHWLTSG